MDFLMLNRFPLLWYLVFIFPAKIVLLLTKKKLNVLPSLILMLLVPFFGVLPALDWICPILRMFLPSSWLILAGSIFRRLNIPFGMFVVLFTTTWSIDVKLIPAPFMDSAILIGQERWISDVLPLVIS